MTTPHLLKVENLAKFYKAARSGAFARKIVAVDGVNFSLVAGTTLAIVGASGSGKSTLAVCLAGLEKPSSGNIWFDGCDLVSLTDSQLRKVRPKIQLVFQDPALSLNPRLSAFEILAEPWRIQKRLTRTQRRDRAAELLITVGLLPTMLDAKPVEFSGGQRQRLAIARALALDPKLLIFDESLSALDPSVQAQIANLLVDLRSARNLTLIFITHDPAMAAHLADEIAVMDRGRIVEQGITRGIVFRPNHPATRALLAAMPQQNFRPPANAVR
jgi:ABC-type glutathione transport system ATPase component